MKWRTIGVLLGLFLLMCAPALAANYVVNVGPPQGSAYDTGLIQGALNACVAHGPGCTVQLDA